MKKIQGVIDLAIGLKQKDGRLTDEVVFQVFVKEKKPEQDLSPGEIIPKKIMGYSTDVLLLPDPVKAMDSGEYRPVMGGIQISNGLGEVGTLGCFARLDSDNSLVILSCEHVIFAGGARPGEKIGQPSIKENCCCCCAYVAGPIATILNPGIDNELVDCAIAKLDPGVSPAFLIGNDMNATKLHIAGTRSGVVAGDHVRKIGITSGLTNGTISSVNAPTVTKKNQIIIMPSPAETFVESTSHKSAFCASGDSGSVIVNDANEIVGLLWGNDLVHNAVVFGIAAHIDDVLAAFKNVNRSITIINTPPGIAATSKPLRHATPRIDTDIRERLIKTTVGRKIVQCFELYHNHVLDLINHNRKVTVTWQRNGGPAFMAHILKSVKDPFYKIPSSVNMVTLQDLMIKMATVLKNEGSIDLRNDINEHSLDLINITCHFESVESLLLRIEEECLLES